MAASRLNDSRTPTSALGYYWALLKALPSFFLTAADLVGNAIFLVAVIALAALLFFLPRVSKDVSDAIAEGGGNPQLWAIAPILVLVVWQLLRANYQWARQVAEERDALWQRIDAATVTQAHPDRLADLRDEGTALMSESGRSRPLQTLGQNVAID